MNTQFLKEIRKIGVSELPMLLKEIPDPPEGLYAYGNIALLYEKDTKFLCVVGSRRYTSYGKELCVSLIKSLKGLPVVIVSGLALGIDGIAHRVAIDTNLRTIAIPGSGLHPDTLYPRSHYYLAEEIVEKGGLLLSEYEPSVRASPWTFPMRNRILAGMSHAVLVIEAEEDSGTLITARLALDYNRDIGAIPGSVLSENSKGTNELIRRGAVAITCKEDLHEFLGFEVDRSTPAGGGFRDPYYECSSEEKEVAEIIYEPKTRNEILELLKIPLSKLQVILSMLEVRGIIHEAYGSVALRYPPPSAILRKNRIQNSENNNGNEETNSRKEI